jgi:hypothetical protein
MNRTQTDPLRILLGVFAAIELFITGAFAWFVASSPSWPGAQGTFERNLILAIALIWFSSATLAVIAFFTERVWPRLVGMTTHSVTIILGVIQGLHSANVISKDLNSSDSVVGLGAIVVAIITFIPLALMIAIAAVGLFLLAILRRPISSKP